MGLHETKKCLHSTGNGHQIEETVYRLGRKSASYSSDKGLNNQNTQGAKKTNPSKNQQPTE
jgi:hypothetical protein